jgi:hypothetical protein
LIHTPPGDGETDFDGAGGLLIGSIRAGQSERTIGGDEHLPGQLVGFVLLGAPKPARAFVGG